MSLSSILSIARSALLTHQRAMAVISHNVANAQTPGYTRQRLNLAAVATATTVGAPIGRGVTEAGIVRTRDRFFDATYRYESGLLGGSMTMRDTLGQIEAAMNEPSETGVSAALDGLWSSFSDLANDPASGTNRDLVRSAADRLCRQIRGLDAQLTSSSEDALAELRAEVAEANSLAEKIAAMNADVRAAHASGSEAPDVEDQRDLMIDQLSSLASVRVVEQEDGTVSVMVGDTTLVEGGDSQTLELKPLPGGGFGVGLTRGAGAIDLGGGSLKALSDLVSTEIPGLRGRLDEFAQSLVTEVNAIHRTGYTLTGQTGTDFFDPAGTSARTIQLTDAVEASGDAIAAGGTSAPGDNTVALQIAALANAAVGSLGGRTMRDFYTDMAADVGSGVQQADNDAIVHDSLVAHADVMRASAGGVSIDEEMVSLIGEQEAYSAAARLVQTADEMIQDLLNMV